MGGTAANRLTTSGSGMSGTTLGATGGAETVTLTAAQIPAHTHPNTLSDPGHNHSYVGPLQTFIQLSGTPSPTPSAGAVTSTSFTGITINNAANTGGGGAHNNMPPSFVCPVIMRII
jgi:microcystin-dependent protein